MYSGNEDRQGTRGVGFTVSKKASRSVLGFTPICERIYTLRIKGKFHNITFVNVCAPTEDTEDELIDEFYETLQSVCDELPTHDAIITLGTWKIPGTNDTNQIDHITVSKRWATDIENIRTYRGANSDSDHFLVGARLKQRIALITRSSAENRKRWNIDKFDETDVERYYQQEVQRKLQENPPSNDIEEEWTYIKEMIITSALNIIGEKQNERNEE
ncbi:hypothetical protein Cfor_07802 [Coptotermes formosanus]|uniref:Endonuclease/exonuclease/phosphatase domain-containing protein n=1 Tax=Coptotermes formosanus TaxID=36987 RepID=A0A6L2PFX9_COPFO|nr:hypothetical protein Cfor_07802 [Coptotermes formosanus]